MAAGLGEMVREGGAQGVAGAIEAEFHGFDGGIGDGRNLLVAKMLVNREDEDFALVRGELGDGGLDSGEFFFSGGPSVGIWGGICVIGFGEESGIGQGLGVAFGPAVLIPS